MDETCFYEPGKGHGLPHDPFKVIVALRPIGWLSTVDPDGRVNLAPSSCRPTRGLLAHDPSARVRGCLDADLFADQQRLHGVFGIGVPSSSTETATIAEHAVSVDDGC